MAGTKESARKAVETNKRLHGENFYHEIGKKSGEYFKRLKEQGQMPPRGFAYLKMIGREDLISAAGSKGGKTSRRSKR